MTVHYLGFVAYNFDIVTKIARSDLDSVYN